MNINEIKPNQSNPRKINKDDFDKLVESIKDTPKLLEALPIIIDENNIIISGHQRYKACLQLGIQDVPVKLMSNLTDKESKKLMIISNTHNGEFDMDILANDGWELADLNDWAVNVDFLVPTNEEPKSIDNTKKGKVCPNCGLSL